MDHRRTAVSIRCSIRSTGGGAFAGLGRAKPFGDDGGIGVSAYSSTASGGCRPTCRCRPSPRTAAGSR